MDLHSGRSDNSRCGLSPVRAPAHFFASGTACVALTEELASFNAGKAAIASGSAERGPPLKVRMYKALLKCVEDQSVFFGQLTRACMAASPMQADHHQKASCTPSQPQKAAAPYVVYGEGLRSPGYGPASGMGVGPLWELKLVFPAPLAKRRGRGRCLMAPAFLFAVRAGLVQGGALVSSRPLFSCSGVPVLSGPLSRLPLLS